MKDGRTHLAHKAEHAVDLDTGAILAVTVQDADDGGTQTSIETLIEAAERIADPSWSSYIATPPSPDYVSGHSTFSGAASRVLAHFYGTDAIAFTTGSDFLPGVTRSFPRCGDPVFRPDRTTGSYSL
jgi:hypothetical protein